MRAMQFVFLSIKTLSCFVLTTKPATNLKPFFNPMYVSVTIFPPKLQFPPLIHLSKSNFIILFSAFKKWNAKERKHQQKLLLMVYMDA